VTSVDIDQREITRFAVSGVMTLAGLFLFAGSSWALGTIALARVESSDLRPFERASLKLLAGLGLTSLLLSLLTLAGRFADLTFALVALSMVGSYFCVRDMSRLTRITACNSDYRRTAAIALAVTASLGCLGAIAPVTDDDALAYVVPIARHIADSGQLTVWADQARSMWPQSQQVLLAYLLAIGGNKLGALTAFEFLLALGAASALARRVCEREEHIPAALIVAFGAPVVAFQIASSKEDLLVVAATAATAACLVGSTRLIDSGVAGLFAGIAAGAKYPGAAVPVAALVWLVTARGIKAFRHLLILSACATLTGGLWYGLNLWRYGNPIAPFLGGAGGTAVDGATIRDFVNGYGAGRTVTAFFAAPVRIFTKSELFCGRANLYNPLIYVGLAGVLISPIRRRHSFLFLAALVLYVIWFLGLQNARFLLPAVVLISPAAADVLVPAIRRWKVGIPFACAAAAISVGVVAAVGITRLVRYAAHPNEFLERETQNYADIQWMNAHLDRRLNRVASDHKVLAYLNTSSLVLDPTYQIEMAQSEIDDPHRFLEACRRQKITHLFGRSDSFFSIRKHLRPIYQNPRSRQGGVRFFREPPTESTVVFEIVDVWPGAPETDR